MNIATSHPMLNLIRRILGLTLGDWVIVLRIREGEQPSYQVTELGRPEH